MAVIRLRQNEVKAKLSRVLEQTATSLVLRNVKSQVARAAPETGGANPRLSWMSRLFQNIRASSKTEANKLFPSMVQTMVGRILSGGSIPPIDINNPFEKGNQSISLQWPQLSKTWMKRKKREGKPPEHFAYEGTLARALGAARATGLWGETGVSFLPDVKSLDGTPRSKILEKSRFIGDLEIRIFPKAEGAVKEYLLNPTRDTGRLAGVTNEVAQSIGGKNLAYRLLGSRATTPYRNLIPPMLLWWAKDKIPNAIITRLQKSHRYLKG